MTKLYGVRLGEAIPKMTDRRGGEQQQVLVYCLFCESQKCSQIARQVELVYPCRAIRPRQVQLKWVKREPVNEIHDLLPGYVFLYAEKEILDFAPIRRIAGVLRVLSDQDNSHILRGDDEAFALMLLEKDGVIGKVPVYEEGQLIRIKDGVFAGLQTRILRVNRRNRQVQIEIPFVRSQIKTWVEFEIVESESTEAELPLDKKPST